MAHPRSTYILPLFVAALLLAAFTTASAAPAPVYRCEEAGKGVTYQDFPCTNGTVVDIRAGAPNPEAIARLERQQEAFDQRFARFRAEEMAAREAAMARAARYEQPPVDTAQADYYPAYPYGYGGFGFIGADRPRHHRGDADDHRLGRRPAVGRVPATIQRPHR